MNEPIADTIQRSSTNRPASRRRFLQTVSSGALGSLAIPCQPSAASVASASPWRMRLAFSSVMFGSLPFEEACQRAAALGFEAIDLWCPFDGCNHLVDVVERLGPDGLKQVLAQHKLGLCSFSTYATRYDPRGFPGYAEFIGKFGGGVVVRGSESAKRKPDQPVDAPPEDLTTWMRGFFERLKPQIELAAQANARLAIENHGNALLNSIDSFKAFVDLNPAPERVGIAMAPYHLQRIQAPVEEAIRVAGSQLLFFYAWQNGTGLDQLPGHGPSDFVPWLQALAGIGYPGYVNPFLHGHPAPDELALAITKSCDYLKQCRAKER